MAAAMSSAAMPTDLKTVVSGDVILSKADIYAEAGEIFSGAKRPSANAQGGRSFDDRLALAQNHRVVREEEGVCLTCNYPIECRSHFCGCVYLAHHKVDS